MTSLFSCPNATCDLHFPSSDGVDNHLSSQGHDSPCVRAAIMATMQHLTLNANHDAYFGQDEPEINEGEPHLHSCIGDHFTDWFFRSRISELY